MAASLPNSSNSTDVQALKDSKKAKGKAKENRSKPSTIPPQGEQWQEQSWNDDTPWDWASLTDPSSSRIPPLFTKDGSYFFSLVGSNIKIYSTATGQVVSTLTTPPSTSSKSHNDVLTAAVLNPHNVFQLITASLDGRLMIWDFINATLLQTINVGQPIHFMCAHAQFKGSVFVAASRQKKKAMVSDNNAVVLQISLKPSDHTSQHPDITPVGKTRFPSGLAVSPNGAWLVATAAHTVYVAKTAALSAGFTKYVSPERLNCLAFHPSEEYFATGDDKGIIRLWYCLNDNLAVGVRNVEKRTQTRSFHWHAHAVSSIAFTSNGAYILSGGEESVLVIWQLQTGKKEFIPRLGAPISTISIYRSRNGEEEYLAGLADASYTFVSSSTLKVTKSFSRIKIDPTISQDITPLSKLNVAPLGVQPLTSTLILPSSHPSSLQLYSLPSSSLISELEVSPSNRVSRRDDKPIIPSTVERVVISDSGRWMATIDTREGDIGFHSEVYLKIWSWDQRQGNWSLNTRIDRPHGTSTVTDIGFSPSLRGSKNVHLLTTGKDGRIKLWALSDQGTSTKDSDVWVQRATLTFRSEIPVSITWSPDASLFAVSVGSQVALYDTLSRSLRLTLTSSECQKIQSAHFVGTDGRYLLAVSPKSLAMWDIIRGSILWQSSPAFDVERVIPHPHESTFAAFHTPISTEEECRTKISIFNVTSSTPISVKSVPFGLRNVIWAPFQRATGYSLVGVTHSWRVVTIGDSRPNFKEEGSSSRVIGTDIQPHRRTLFQDIFGATAFSNTPVETAQFEPVSRSKDVGLELFAEPAYATPSIDILFDSLVKQFLETRPIEQNIKPDNPDEWIEEDVDMEGEVLVSSEPGLRAPNVGEMDTFIKLFRASCMTGMPCSSYLTCW
ncbi:WD40 repeat-like protein [Agrocybe pediades]|nr:WD40 repeat-like protein [Agrocybe pediades]